VSYIVTTFVPRDDRFGYRWDGFAHARIADEYAAARELDTMDPVEMRSIGIAEVDGRYYGMLFGSREARLVLEMSARAGAIGDASMVVSLN
jgi:hypothetical protein